MSSFTEKQNRERREREIETEFISSMGIKKVCFWYDPIDGWEKEKKKKKYNKKKDEHYYHTYNPHEQSSSCILYMGKSSRFNNLFLVLPSSFPTLSPSLSSFASLCSFCVIIIRRSIDWRGTTIAGKDERNGSRVCMDRRE